ncbi:MAG TPA: FAD-dependent oxidoreductase [Polyangiaceae bacterium]
MAGKRYVIIGDGAAGTTAAQALRLADASAQITIVSDDPHAAYFRASLTNYLLGELREDQVWAVPPTFYGELRIHRLLARVVGVDVATKTVALQTGHRLPYDALVIASGARARPPPFEGGFLPGVMTMRTLQDVRTVMDLIRARNLKNAVVVGGGPLALEWAHGLSHRGVRVGVVVRERRFLPASMDAIASDLLAARMKRGGVDVRMGDEIAQAVPGQDGRVAGVVLKSGQRMACELLAVAVGVICNTEFLRGTPVQLAPNGGVLVGDDLRSSVPDVYAAGDCAAVGGKLLQLWEPARVQGHIVADQIHGKPSRWTPGAYYMATRLYDLDFAGAGGIDIEGAEAIVDFPEKTGKISYRKLWVKEGKLKGYMLLGERTEAVRKKGRLYKRLVDEEKDVGPIKDRLLDRAFDLAAWLKPLENEKPAPVSVQAPGAPHVTSSAKMRGTQAFSLSDLPKLAPPTSTPSPPVQSAPANNSKPGTSILVLKEPPPPAHLEGPQGRVELGARCVIGTAPDCQVVLRDPHVSDAHAQITRHGSAIYLRDLGSRTGTWVNHRPVSTPVELANADQIRVGATTFTVRMATGTRLSMPAVSMGPSSLQLQQIEGPRLIVRSGSGIGLTFALANGRTTVGRSYEATVRLDDPSIAPLHATIEIAGGTMNIAPMQAAVVLRGVPIPQNQWTHVYESDVMMIGGVALEYASKAPAQAGPISMQGARA